MAKRKPKRGGAEELIGELRQKTDEVHSYLTSLGGDVADSADRITGNADAASYMQAAKKSVEKTSSALDGLKMALHAAAGAAAEGGADVQDSLPLEAGDAADAHDEAGE